MIPADNTAQTWTKFQILVAGMINEDVMGSSTKQLEFIFSKQDCAKIFVKPVVTTLMVNAHNTKCRKMFSKYTKTISSNGNTISGLCPMCQFVHSGLCALFPDHLPSAIWTWDQLVIIADMVLRILPNVMNQIILDGVERVTAKPQAYSALTYGQLLYHHCGIKIDDDLSAQITPTMYHYKGKHCSIKNHKLTPYTRDGHLFGILGRDIDLARLKMFACHTVAATTGIALKWVVERLHGTCVHVSKAQDS